MSDTTKSEDEIFCLERGWFPASSLDLGTWRERWHMTGQSEPRHIHFEFYSTRAEAATGCRKSLETLGASQ